ncbi:MAG: hypothetical protein QHH15_03680 [Candidatus Thermoplasmatota archaeon]|nr:hypothetical protein [Candidatus Thermoplasmatota archaeon]
MFLHLLNDDLIDSKNKKDEVFELMIKELLDSKHKQKNKFRVHD